MRPRSGAGLRAAESVGPDSAPSEPNGTAYNRHREKRSNQRAPESHTKKHVFKLTERTVSVSVFPQGHLRPQTQEGWLPPVGSPWVSPFSGRPSPFVLVKSTLQTAFHPQPPARGETRFERGPSTVRCGSSGRHWDRLCGDAAPGASLGPAARGSFVPSRNHHFPQDQPSPGSAPAPDCHGPVQPLLLFSPTESPV